VVSFVIIGVAWGIILINKPSRRSAPAAIEEFSHAPGLGDIELGGACKS